MQLYSISTGYFKLDGGAMFGVVPKTLWQKINPADSNNLCTWAMRCLLVVTGDRKILIDVGMGDKQDEKFKSHFHPHGEDSLLLSIANLGYTPDDITDVFITHMHFDHVGGAVIRDSDGQLKTTFPRATYWTNKKHLSSALNPNEREKASFLKENILPLVESSQLEFIEPCDELSWQPWLEGIDVLTLQGHTDAMMILRIPYHQTFLYYGADLIPSAGHIPVPYVMSYDIRPLQTLIEKKFILEEILNTSGYLFYEHDPLYVCSTLKILENSRIVSDQSFKALSEII